MTNSPAPRAAAPPATVPDGPLTALVTGASRGIGADVAAHLAAAGHRVLGVSRSGTAPGGVEPVSCDVRDAGALAGAVRDLAEGRVDVLVAAAGVAPAGLAARGSEVDWCLAVDTNLTGSFHAARAVLPGMLARRWGRIVLVSSVLAARGGTGLSAYGAAKAGVEGLTRSLAREVAGRGVTVNAVAPGFIDTAMTAGLAPGTREGYLMQIPAGRLGEVAEVTAVIAFLASPQSSYVTGAVVPVDGGMGMGR